MRVFGLYDGRGVPVCASVQRYVTYVKVSSRAACGFSLSNYVRFCKRIMSALSDTV